MNSQAEEEQIEWDWSNNIPVITGLTASGKTNTYGQQSQHGELFPMQKKTTIVQKDSLEDYKIFME